MEELETKSYLWDTVSSSSLKAQQERNAASMWSGFDPELRRQLDVIRHMVARTHQVPTQEWPLVFMHDYDVLFVVREWPDGTITAYSTSQYSDLIRDRGSV
jgi:hypothetical protein